MDLNCLDSLLRKFRRIQSRYKKIWAGTRNLLTLACEYENNGNYNAKPMNISSLTKTAFLAACVALFSNASAHATLVAWSLNPDNLNQDLNTNTAAFTVAGYTITARGYDNWDGNGHARDLHYKSEGADEFGLGLRG